MSLSHFAKAALFGVSLTAVVAFGASAKTLVYCSEGSPEGFNPSLYTAGTTFDASSRQVFNRLVEFERGWLCRGPGPKRRRSIASTLGRLLPGRARSGRCR